MYDIVKLQLMVPCRFDSLKIYIGVFVMIWTNMAFQEPHKTYFCILTVLSIIFRLYSPSAYLPSKLH